MSAAANPDDALALGLAPVLDWANTVTPSPERAALQRIVDRLHSLHPLSHAEARVGQGGWKLGVVSASTGQWVDVPCSGLLMRGAGRDDMVALPPPTARGRDMLAELARTLDGVLHAMRHPTHPPFRASLLAMALMRSVLDHDRFAEVVTAPDPVQQVDWRDDAWTDVHSRHAGSSHPGNGRFLEWERGPDDWTVRVGGRAWDFNRTHLFALGVQLPDSALAACRARPLDEIVLIPELAGAGLVVRAVRQVVRDARPSLRITIAKRMLTDVGEALSMSRDMDRARAVAATRAA